MTTQRECAGQPLCELSRVIAIDEIGKAGFDVEIDANNDQRASLAHRFGLVAISEMTARVRVERLENRGLRVRGRFAALVVQNCVVTLESFEARVEDVIDVLFAPVDGGVDRDVLIAALDDDAPEPLRGDFIDVGEVIAEIFGLAIDDYPRRPGATFAGVQKIARPSDDETPKSPFAALRKFKPKP